MSAVLMCLALNIYFEARNQSLEGQRAVASVVFNRVRDPRYPDNICDVVYQAKRTGSGKVILNSCAFSWYCDGLSDIPRDRDAFRWAQHVALMAVYGNYPDVTGGATHYHTLAVNPKWRIQKVHTCTIGDHIFYRWI